MFPYTMSNEPLVSKLALITAVSNPSPVWLTVPVLVLVLYSTA